jgi:hypothetical protein
MRHQLVFVTETEMVPGGLSVVAFTRSKPAGLDRNAWLLLAQQRRWNTRVLLALLDAMDEALFADDAADEPEKDYADD